MKIHKKAPHQLIGASMLLHINHMSDFEDGCSNLLANYEYTLLNSEKVEVTIHLGYSLHFQQIL